MGFLDSIGGYGTTSALGNNRDSVNLNLGWMPKQTNQESFGTFKPDSTNALNTYGTKSIMDGSNPQDTGLTLSKLGEYGKVASQWTQPIALGLNAYSTFFGQGKKAFNKNMKLLDQQIAENKDKLKRRSALNAAWARTEKG